MRYLLIIAAVITFSACQEKIPMNNELECPDYDPTTLNTWFPYQQDVTYNYADSTGDIHWLAIKNVKHISGDEPAEGWNCTPATTCMPAGVVFAYRDINQYDKICLNAIHEPTAAGGRFTFAWNSQNIEIVVNSDGSLSLDPLYDERPEQYYKDIKPEFIHHTQLWLNEVSYNDVYEITFRKNEMGNARKVYLAKGKGVVGYQANNSRTYWAK